MPRVPRVAACLLGLLLLAARAQGLPPEVGAALARAKLPRDAIAVLVADVEGKEAPRLSYRASAWVNPASVAKLVTTFAALELLGPAYTWATPVYTDGEVHDGTLEGNLYIKGQGDPKLVLERLWLLLRRVQGLGIRTITGDIVLDHSAFEAIAHDPAAFDGEPLRPYNAAPDALLINFKSLLLTFTPERDRALVQSEPPLADFQVPASVPLSGAECNDWRASLKADFSDPDKVRFAGSYPARCGERVWPVAYADPGSYSARAVAGLWKELGGRLGGRARDGKVPADLKPRFELVSPPLAEVIRDINKFSNNVMAQQVFLTLSLQKKGYGTLEGSRELLRAWWRERLGGEPPSIDNGSGLSREDRISAQQLAQLLQLAWASPLMPELASSLSLNGTDGTLRRVRGKASGVAHLKTGSLRDVAAVAGYVDGAGHRYALVAVVNHPNAISARPAIEALIEWAARGP